MLKSTARTHLRNKSGLTAPSTTFEISDKNSHLSKLSNINASKRVREKPIKSSNISVSEFTFYEDKNVVPAYISILETECRENEMKREE